MKIKSYIKACWDIMPIAFFINLLARLLIASAVLSYLRLMGSSSFMVDLIITLWALMPFYYSVRGIYYDLICCQTPHTLLINHLIKSIYGLEKASKKRINATKQRLWVERNPGINIYNYWFLKYLRRKEWENIDIEKEKIK